MAVHPTASKFDVLFADSLRPQIDRLFNGQIAVAEFANQLYILRRHSDTPHLDQLFNSQLSRSSLPGSLPRSLPLPDSLPRANANTDLFQTLFVFTRIFTPRLILILRILKENRRDRRV